MFTIPTEQYGNVQVVFTPRQVYRLAKGGLHNTRQVVAAIYGENMKLLSTGVAIKSNDDEDVPRVGARLALARAVGAFRLNTRVFEHYADREAIRHAFADAWPLSTTSGSVPVIAPKVAMTTYGKQQYGRTFAAGDYGTVVGRVPSAIERSPVADANRASSTTPIPKQTRSAMSNMARFGEALRQHVVRFYQTTQELNAAPIRDIADADVVLVGANVVKNRFGHTGFIR